MKSVDTPEEFDEWLDQLHFDFATPGFRVWRNVVRRLHGRAPLKPRWSRALCHLLAARRTRIS